MKIHTLVSASLIAITAVTFFSSCGNRSANLPPDISKGIFAQGKPGADSTFTGNAYNLGLMDPDSVYTTAVGNVYFEPGARSHWHSHPGGQILIITDGTGFHQIKGQMKQTLHKGDVVKCPPNTLHWHGASPDTGMQQLYIVPNTEKGIVDWKEAVTDEEYRGNK